MYKLHRTEECNKILEIIGIAGLGNKEKERNIKMFTVFKYCLKKAKVILYLSTTADIRVDKNKLLLFPLYFTKLAVLKAVAKVWKSFSLPLWCPNIDVS